MSAVDFNILWSAIDRLAAEEAQRMCQIVMYAHVSDSDRKKFMRALGDIANPVEPKELSMEDLARMLGGRK